MKENTKIIKTIEVNSIEEYLAEQNFYSETDYFRGQSSINYKLIPSIGRLLKEGKEQTLLQFEKIIFKDFKHKSPMFTDTHPIYMFQILRSMKNYFKNLQ